MIKKSIYGKTSRFNDKDKKVQVTEKLDGSNLTIFKLDGTVYYAQRNNIFSEDEIELISYKGLVGWAKEHNQFFKENLLERTALSGEWMGMGQINYNDSDIDGKFYAFCKSKIKGDTLEEVELISRHFFVEHLQYVFECGEMPEFIKVVPLVGELTLPVGEAEVQELYDEYCSNFERKVEGFILYNRLIDTIQKCVYHKPDCRKKK